MKLNISNLGIYDPIKSDLEDAISNLKSAKSSLSSPPASFSESGYMSGVPSKINDLIRKITNLSDSSSRIDQKYKDYLLDKKTKFNNLDDYTLKERIGLSEQFQMSSSKYNVNSEIFLTEGGLLTFGVIADATGIKSALPGNGASVIKEAENHSNSSQPNNPKIPDEQPDIMNIASDGAISSNEVIKDTKQDNTSHTTTGSIVPGTHSPGTLDRTYEAKAYNLSPDEYQVLCATVYAEAAEGNEYTYSDTMGVTSSILNRMESGDYGGSSVTAVVSAPNQFEGYGYGNQKFSRAMNDISCIPPDMMQAINDTLAGNRNTEGYSFFGNGTYNTFR